MKTVVVSAAVSALIVFALWALFWLAVPADVVVPMPPTTVAVR